MNEERLALFLPSLRGGGAERVMVNLANGFAAQGHPVDMVLCQVEGTYLQQLSNRVRVVDLHAPRVRSSVGRLIGYLKDVRPTGLLSALDHANMVALVAQKIAGTKTSVVITLHNTPSEKQKHRTAFEKLRFRRMVHVAFPWSQAIVAVSGGVADDYARETGLDRERISVVFNPVITPELQRQASEPVSHPWFNATIPVILNVGRLTPQKNQQLLIRAFHRVRESREARLVILGEGELRHELETLITRLDLSRDVWMPGFVENPYAFMARAALFVLSSSWEGLPTVLIEALAVGTPVVSCDCKSGPDEILRGGELGRLVPEGDVDALAAAITGELDRRQPGAGRLQHPLNEFSLECAVDRYLSLLRG